MTGEYIVAGLLKLQETQPLIGDVRGHGLFIGFELVTDRKVCVSGCNCSVSHCAAVDAGEQGGEGIAVDVQAQRRAADRRRFGATPHTTPHHINTITHAPHAGPLNNVIKIKPPIVFNKHNADQMLREVERALSSLAAKAHL